MWLPADLPFVVPYSKVTGWEKNAMKLLSLLHHNEMRGRGEGECEGEVRGKLRDHFSVHYIQ